MLAQIRNQALRFVGTMVGYPSQHGLSVELGEVPLVWDVRAAISRGLEHRVFQRVESVAGVGSGSQGSLSLWSNNGWSITGDEGGGPGPVPSGQDAIIIGGGIFSSTGGARVIQAVMTLDFESTAGAVTRIPLLEAVAGPGNNLFAPFLRGYYLPKAVKQGMEKQLLIGWDVTAATDLTYHLEVLSGDPGLIPFL